MFLVAAENDYGECRLPLICFCAQPLGYGDKWQLDVAHFGVSGEAIHPNRAVAVRLGVGKERINRALGIEPAPAAPLPEKESEQAD